VLTFLFSTQQIRDKRGIHNSLYEAARQEMDTLKSRLKALYRCLSSASSALQLFLKVQYKISINILNLT
jgi:hypothetical protein